MIRMKEYMGYPEELARNSNALSDLQLSFLGFQCSVSCNYQ